MRMFLFAALSAACLHAQNPTKKAKAKPADTTGLGEAKKNYATAFFDTEKPLVMELKLNVKQIRGDKGDDAPWRDATLSYTDSAGQKVSVPTRVRTRGIWRRRNCEFPPLRLNFKAEDVKGTVFKGLDKPKLVNYCKDYDDYDDFMLSEYQLYRVYNVLNPETHKARLVKMTVVDSASGKPNATRWGHIQEEPEALGARMNAMVMKQQGAGPNDVEPYTTALFGVFEYFIGNTDWGISVLHNAELYARTNGDLIPVAHDFDFSGVVNAKYATPDPRLHLRSVRDRLMRGYCVDPAEFEKVRQLFLAKKNAIYALYADDIGKLQNPRTVTETLRYYDEAYRVFSDPRQFKRDIIDQCAK